MLKQRGVTLIELLVTISIAAILLALGVPSMGDFLRSNRVSGATNDLAAMLYLARSEAVKRGANVTVCPDSDADSTCEATTDWNDGVVVLANAAPIRRMGAAPQVTMTNTVNSVIYDSRGVAAAGTITLTEGTCPDRTQRQIDIAATGRIQVTRVDCP
jgi:type IV fimbrial biogenesis protein FimT